MLALTLTFGKGIWQSNDLPKDDAAMFVLGGRVRGGKVYGRWPGLAPEVLYEGRDLDLTTDYRTVCAEVLARHMAQRELSKVFPSFRAPSSLGLVV